MFIELTNKLLPLVLLRGYCIVHILKSLFICLQTKMQVRKNSEESKVKKEFVQIKTKLYCIGQLNFLSNYLPLKLNHLKANHL